MAYWWVNQNQTYVEELNNGFLWSPQKNANGARNQFYDNMLELQPGDLVFSFANTYISHVGIVQHRAVEAQKPDFAGRGMNWSERGWKADVEFVKLPKAIRPMEHMSVLAPLLPEKYAPLQANGRGLQGVYLAKVPDAMGSLLLQLLGDPEIAIETPSLAELAYDPEEQELVALQSIPETERATLILARRGQGIFRSRVMVLEERCRVTGVASEKLLIASHIKPWKDSDHDERLSGSNGLFLSPHVDRLFDQGWITFTPNGSMEVSTLLDEDVLPKWSIDPNANYGRFNNEQAYFLEFHNTEKFRVSDRAA